MHKAEKYLTSLQGKGWNVDGFTTHIYPDVGAGPDLWYSMLVDAKTSIASFNPPSAVLWVTETNYNVPSGPVISEADAPAMVNSTYAYAAAEGIADIFWYGWDTSANIGGLDINMGTSAWTEIQQH